MRIVAELDSANQIVSRFVYSTSQNVPEYMVRGGVIYRLITDQLGNLRLVVDASTGMIVEQMNYDEYGNVLLDSNPGFVQFGFSGGLYDSQTKLLRFGARDYEASVGRWTRKDPILFQSCSTNHFAFANSNPIVYSDPKGTYAFNAEQALSIVTTFASITDMLNTLGEMLGSGGRTGLTPGRITSLYMDTYGMVGGTGAFLLASYTRKDQNAYPDNPFSALAQRLGLHKYAQSVGTLIGLGVAVGLAPQGSALLKKTLRYTIGAMTTYVGGKVLYEGYKNWTEMLH